ncbi:MAG: type II toxin-antitoxin system ParD family antitoxin [Candidatus Paracaedimonas acanthamoebae]|mgnify:CR=1 FL=1|uniref:Type II toxin-antitoxin system ParD family antitoxin n=1 Tax=Candidatus Paracaedimonas acanthamoebae TaxID=244581 RepID=A0A8J7PJL6_9PROT|nr:type II toxin-antitoxin system ParD family antitoxin [Candidatus Paracaedimonas acanthamoebae]
MNISLNSNLEKFIHQKVEQGYYNSASEVVRDALRLFIEKETLFKQQVDKLNHDIELGLSQLSKGQGIEGDQIFQEIKMLNKKK